MTEWETMDHHINFTKKDYYGPFIEELSQHLAGDITFIHVPFKPFPPTAALNGPVVEYTLFDSKDEGEAKKEIEQVTKEILELADNHPKCTGTAFAFAVEKPHQAVLLLSWPTLDVSDHLGHVCA
jgi:hypothetical protein